MKNFVTKSLQGLFFFALTTLPAFAQDAIDLNQDPATLSDAGRMIDAAAAVIFPALIAVTLVMGLVGAVMWMMASGDANRLKLAQGTLTWAVIGFIFTLAAWVFARYLLGIIMIL